MKIDDERQFTPDGALRQANELLETPLRRQRINPHGRCSRMIVEMMTGADHERVQQQAFLERWEADREVVLETLREEVEAKAAQDHRLEGAEVLLAGGAVVLDLPLIGEEDGPLQRCRLILRPDLALCLIRSTSEPKELMQEETFGLGRSGLTEGLVDRYLWVGDSVASPESRADAPDVRRLARSFFDEALRRG